MNYILKIKKIWHKKFSSNDFQKIDNFNSKKHIPVRNKKKRFFLLKNDYLKENREKISLVIITDKNYFPLALEQIRSFFFVEPESCIYLYDIGLNEDQKKEIDLLNLNILIKTINFDHFFPDFKIERNLKVYLLKIFAVKETIDSTTNNIIIYSDAANLFLGKLNRLKNFVSEFGFYAGMTQTYIYKWIEHHQILSAFTDSIDLNIYNKQYVGIEGGFWCFNRNHVWVNQFIDEFYKIAQDQPQVFSIWPGDQIIISVLINKYMEKYDLTLNETPNIRFLAVHDKRNDFEKGMEVFNYEIEKVPFFGYVYHNCSNKAGVPEIRQCTFEKASFKNYMIHD